MTPPVPGPSDGLNAAVAAELRAERARQQVSVQLLAERSQVPYPSVRRYLAAERHIDVAVLAALCDALGVSMTEIIETAAAAMQRAKLVDELAQRRRPDTDDEVVVAVVDLDPNEPANTRQRAARKTPRRPSNADRD